MPELRHSQATATTGTERIGRVASETRGDDAAGTPAPAADRMLVYRGAMTVGVARAEDAMAQFLAKTKEWGGYMSSQEDRQVTVRIPAAQFETAFTALRALGQVLAESRQANDVTEEYVDLGIRLDNARKGRDRLLELLAKADKVEDMLKIEEQLRRLTEEIERMVGRQKLLADQVAMATLTAMFVENAPSGRPPGARKSRFDWIRAVGAERVLGGW